MLSRESPPDTTERGLAAVWAGSRRLRLAVSLILGLLVLGAGAAVSAYWLTNKPKPERRPPRSASVLVEIMPIRHETKRVTIRAMGTVIACQTIQLAPRVSGDIVQVSREFLPGGRFAAGDLILRIDPRDYQFVVRQKAYDVAQADRDLKLELGQQSVAKREYELLKDAVEKEDQELVLRKPQLKTAHAALASAQASLAKAELDLKRTDVQAPFNAMVQSRQVNLGSQVSTGTQLAELVGTDEYWVEASVPVDQLKWIKIPTKSGQSGSPVRVHYAASWGAGIFRKGYVLRLATELEPQGRMAKLIASIRDPLSLAPGSAGQPAMILGAYVRIEIDGKDLPDVVRVPRLALRDGSNLWIVSPRSTLDVRSVKIAWSSRDFVYVADELREGESLIISGLATPVQGMALRVASAKGRGTTTRASGPASQPGPKEPR